MTIQINATNLRAARRARKLSIDEVSSHLKISEDRLRSFEDGSKEPTSKQLLRLTELYNVSLFDVYGAGNLELDPVLPDFRKINAPMADLSPAGLQRLWKVESASTLVDQLASYLEESPEPQLLSVSQSNAIPPSGGRVREQFDIWRARHARRLKYQGTDAAVTFRLLRHFMENVGCLTMMGDAPADDYLGFYKAFGDNFDTVFVNKSITNEKRQLFTLAHELGHFLASAEGISDPFSGSKNKIEKACNEFAAEFLAPQDEVLNLISEAPRDIRTNNESLVSFVSTRSLLSLQASALRLRELDVITRESSRAFFGSNRAKVEESEARSRVKESRPMGRSVSVGRKLSEVGVYAAYVAGEAVSKKIIEPIDVSRSMNISENLQPDVFDLAKRRFEASRS